MRVKITAPSPVTVASTYGNTPVSFTDGVAVGDFPAGVVAFFSANGYEVETTEPEAVEVEPDAGETGEGEPVEGETTEEAPAEAKKPARARKAN